MGLSGLPRNKKHELCMFSRSQRVDKTYKRIVCCVLFVCLVWLFVCCLFVVVFCFFVFGGGCCFCFYFIFLVLF